MQSKIKTLSNELNTSIKLINNARAQNRNERAYNDLRSVRWHELKWNASGLMCHGKITLLSHLLKVT